MVLIRFVFCGKLYLSCHYIAVRILSCVFLIFLLFWLCKMVDIFKKSWFFIDNWIIIRNFVSRKSKSVTRMITLNNHNTNYWIGQIFAQSNNLYITHSLYNSLYRRKEWCVRIRSLMAACADALRVDELLNINILWWRILLTDKRYVL